MAFRQTGADCPYSNYEDLKLYSASFFSELFAFLDVDRYAKKVNVNYFNSLDHDIRCKLEKELYSSTWKPSSCFINEHSFDKDSIWQRVSDVINWKTGSLSLQNLEEKYFKQEFVEKDFRIINEPDKQ